MSVFPPNIKSLPEWAQDRLRWLEQREDNMRAEIAELKARLAAAEAEAERASGALVEVRRMIESDAYRASITARIDAHLASRPEGEVPDGR